MFGFKRRSLMVALTGVLMAVPALAAFPDKPIKLVVPYPAGGLTDILARTIAHSITQSSGQPVVVDNRSGANGAIGAVAVARAAPDGYTVLVSNTDTHAINPFIYKKLAYDPVKDFEPVSLFATVPFALVVGKANPASADFKSFVAAAKAKPRALTFASWGVGSASHLGMELVSTALGVTLHHVPFSGQAPGIQAVQAGHVDAMMLQPGGADAAARSGTAKVLAVTSDKRLPLLPDAPTLRELGVDVVTGNWFSIHVPKGTKLDVISRINQLVKDALSDPKVQETFRAQSAMPESSTPDQLGSYVLSEQRRWGAIARSVSASLD
ncbi:Bug family tripartite tricarboxylate transporter substrate binding protein [Ottowia thiooxydans]|uniref:Bug family tripartite tricarboxylate transporter substrate binding protein n=1 Tax=Ottowia thiooxydans TaxID=219182 RepID=UPI000400AEB4|nr:tripartite tricarboxylate transporter substrate binding protein [Ottowia thiooxydans]